MYVFKREREIKREGDRETERQRERERVWSSRDKFRVSKIMYERIPSKKL